MKALAGYTYEHIDFTKEVIGVSARNMAYGFSQEDTSDFSEARFGVTCCGLI